MKYVPHLIIAIVCLLLGFFAHRELAIDACLDAGGMWKAEPGVCVGIMPTP